MKYSLIPKLLTVIFALSLIAYVAMPDQGFPSQIPGSLQSLEPGDTETPLRKAYFTDLTREEVINHYKNEFSYMPTLRLNYPPEEAQTIIRDQTRSTFLEELVHPLRESIYINGFEPSEQKDAIIIDKKQYRQKITVRYVPSSPVIRMLVALVTAISIYFIYIAYQKIALKFTKIFK